MDNSAQPVGEPVVTCSDPSERPILRERPIPRERVSFQSNAQAGGARSTGNLRAREKQRGRFGSPGCSPGAVSRCAFSGGLPEDPPLLNE